MGNPAQITTFRRPAKPADRYQPSHLTPRKPQLRPQSPILKRSLDHQANASPIQ
jgi:hypothetical protein